MNGDEASTTLVFHEFYIYVHHVRTVIDLSPYPRTHLPRNLSITRSGLWGKKGCKTDWLQTKPYKWFHFLFAEGKFPLPATRMSWSIISSYENKNTMFQC